VSGRSWLLAGLGLAALILLGVGGRHAGESFGYQAGQVVGFIIVPLLVGLLLWSVVWVLGLRRRRPWASAWIVGIALIVGLLVTLSRGAESAERTAEAERLAGARASDHLRDCAEGVLESYDTASPTEREAMPYTREQFSRIGVEYCREAELRGFFEREELPSRAQQQEMMLEVIERMEANGQLPPT
jgi:hypothetical protein